MPADKKVSVGWQVIFTFLPVVNFWAFYRVRKLRKYVAYVVVPDTILTILVMMYTLDTLDSSYFDGTALPETTFYDDFLSEPIITLSYIGGYGLLGFSIYLVVIWSRRHNSRYDQPTLQPSG